MAHDSVLSLIGQTPLVTIRRLNPHPGVTILAKVESKNIGGSVKDRVALAMIEAAERSGELTPGKTVIEATSGNTGIGLAMVCAVKGYRLKLLMSEFASEERKRILLAYGAEIVLTPGHLSTDGAIEEAYRLAREEPERYVLLDQYNNLASVEAHRRGTAREIWEQTGGAVTHAVATLGTTGTAMGLAKGLKELRPDIVVAAVEPNPGHKIQGLKNMQESYPPGIYDRRALDAVLRVEDAEAFELARRMAREEGLLVGMSAGAALGGALQIARELAAAGRPGVIVFISPDSGERYLSTELFASAARHGLRIYDLARKQPAGLDAVGADGADAGLFTTGPGLDRLGDLDAWRRIVLLDVLRRALAERGGKARLLAGLADMDDSALAAARKAKLSREAFVAQALGELRATAEALGVAEARFLPAGEALDQGMAMLRKLLRRGLAYEKLRSVYFDVQRDKDYGRLAGMDLAGLSHGKTVDLAAYIKDNPQDFTLLKRVSLQDLKLGDALETEWGKVRPSWFLQHAAAAAQAARRLAVVLADEAMRFPHLENFRSLWDNGAGLRPTAWMCARGVEGEGDAAAQAGVMDLAAALELMPSGLALRMWLLSVSYHKPLHATRQSLAMWARNWRRVQECFGALTDFGGEGSAVNPDMERAAQDVRQALTSAVEEDLALHRFWTQLFAFVKLVNARLAAGRLTRAEAELCAARLAACDLAVGFLDRSLIPAPRRDWPVEVQELVAAREKARKAGDFAAADRLRQEVARRGFRLEDAAAGPRLYTCGATAPGEDSATGC